MLMYIDYKTRTGANDKRKREWDKGVGKTYTCRFYLQIHNIHILTYTYIYIHKYLYNYVHTYIHTYIHT